MPKQPLPNDLRGQELIKLLARDRYERGLQQRIDSLLLEHFEEVTRTILSDPKALSGAGGARTAQLFTRVVRIITKGYDAAEKLSVAEVQGYVGVEAMAAKAQLRSMISDSENFRVTMGNLTRAELRAIASMPIEGLPLGEWWEKQAHDMSFASRQQIQLGMVAGEPPRDIARRIIPTDTKPAVWRQARMRANLVVRTTLTTVQNEAAFQSYSKVGPEVSPSYTYVSAKDNRVTPICRALDGRHFKYNDPNAKIPPQHIQCRSTIVPDVNYKALGIAEPTKTSSLSFRSYSDWLKDQSKTQQEQILGVKKAEMWRSGQVTLERMVGQDNRTLNLQQLKDLITVVDEPK